MKLDIQLTKPPRSGLSVVIIPQPARGVRRGWRIEVAKVFAEESEALRYSRALITNLGQEEGAIRR